MILHATRRVRTALLAAALVLGGTLSACGGESSGDTTCGEFAAMSASEKRDLIREGVAESDSDDSQAALDAASDADLDRVADIVDSTCEFADDDTKLDDLDE